jgi:hypothetical protein
MDYKETIQNFKANFKRGYKYKDSNLIFVTTIIYTKAFFIASKNWALNKQTPKTLFENETNVFKAWICYIVATEILRR